MIQFKLSGQSCSQMQPWCSCLLVVAVVCVCVCH